MVVIYVLDLVDVRVISFIGRLEGVLVDIIRLTKFGNDHTYVEQGIKDELSPVS